MKKVLAVIGARPQFVKHFPFELAAKQRLELITLHTGQHYDENMSDVFFNQLGMAQPAIRLDIGSGRHGLQTAKMMIEIEEVCIKLEPDAIMVYGDTNSTLAAALVGAKLHIPIFHVEAGLRSYNKKMPEEVNRILTDHISALLFVPSDRSTINLANEGIRDGVVEVGDIMKDVVLYVTKNNLAVVPNVAYDYYYATLHRPYNVDHSDRLQQLLHYLNALAQQVIFSIHPRTKNKMKSFGLDEAMYSNITFIGPQGYLENIGYLQAATALITDSGGMQKEAYWLKKKCVTVRSETEWVETLADGANTLVFDNLEEVKNVLVQQVDLWDDGLYGSGRTANLIVDRMIDFLGE